MAHAHTVNVTQLVNQQKIGRFNISLLAWSFIAIFVDGFDLGAMGFAAPEIIREWAIDRSAMSTAFAAGSIGSIVGALGFGVLGDVVGRKKTAIAAQFVCGTFTLATLWATGLEQLVFVRFLAGIGFGGIAPILIALNDEFAPRRLRATMVILMFTGYSLGASTVGVVSVWLVPLLGWRAIFVVGGVAPLLVGVCLIFAFPESLKFLVVKGTRRAEVARLARRLSPGLVVAPESRFVIDDQNQEPTLSPKPLFAEGLAFMTPLLWLGMMANFMAVFFLNSWLPTLLRDGGAGMSRATVATTLFHVGGTVGGIGLSRMMDTYGLSAVTGLFVLGVPVIVVLGVSGLPSALLFLAAFVAGACTIGNSFGLNSVAAMLYPTSLRSTGVGWALMVGRIGSVVGPVIGGALLSAQFSASNLFLAAASPLVLAAGASYGLKRRFSPVRGTAGD